MNKSKKVKNHVLFLVLYLALPVIILLIWKAADIGGYIKPYTMPAPEKVLKTAGDILKDGTLIKHIVASFLRVLEGFLISLILALTLGIGVGLSKKLEIFTDITVQIIKPIPPIAWIPLAILWFGIGEFSKIFIIVLGAFFPILLNVVDGIKNIDDKYLELGRVYEVPKAKFIRGVILPGALPSIMTGVRLGLGNAWVCVVAAEMIAATKGVGYMLTDGRNMSRPDLVILGMLIIGIVGKLMDDVLKKISIRITKWN
ncbi:ABC transporter permease [Clostridium chromiireducens]|uniref:ABC transporter permease n=1 Tax=Clostridium chromiireducens TaxID=225345 RepID=A0A399IJ18_9CLOT|nr:ABC transporter permease [Clostridium chromiireducens]RII33018.1 ABC transporter permease [Clostridium chromiireducens]